MKLKLNGFTSTLAFILMNVKTSEGDEVLALNVEGVSTEDLNATGLQEGICDLVSELSTEFYPANAVGLYRLSVDPYTYSAGDYKPTLVVKTEQGDLKCVFCPTLQAHVLASIESPVKLDEVTSNPVPVPYLNSFKIDQLDTQNDFTAFGLIPHNPYIDWELTINDFHDDSAHEYTALVSYLVDGKRVAKLMEVVTDDLELARGLIGLKLDSNVELVVHGVYELFTLEKLEGTPPEVILKGQLEPRLGVIQIQPIAKLVINSGKYVVESMLLELPESTNLRVLDTSINALLDITISF